LRELRYDNDPVVSTEADHLWRNGNVRKRLVRVRATGVAVLRAAPVFAVVAIAFAPVGGRNGVAPLTTLPQPGLTGLPFSEGDDVVLAQDFAASPWYEDRAYRHADTVCTSGDFTVSSFREIGWTQIVLSATGEHAVAATAYLYVNSYVLGRARTRVEPGSSKKLDLPTYEDLQLSFVGSGVIRIDGLDGTTTIEGITC
jgi:hypothetical protein